MINYYFDSKIGISHSQRKKPLQDASDTIVLKNGIGIAVIADGVGSALYADTAAKKAVKTVIDYLKSKLNKADLSNVDFIDTLKEAYTLAMNNNIKLASGYDRVEDYDTTLDTVIFWQNSIFYGHSGDGGIIALNKNGLYEAITEPKKGNDGISVIPLRLGPKYWEFGRKLNEYAAVMLATDGVYETLVVPPFADFKGALYTQLLEVLMNLAEDELTSRELKAHKEEAFDYFYNKTSVKDDLTISVMYDTETIPERQPDSYYEAPKWNEIERKRNMILYGREERIKH